MKLHLPGGLRAALMACFAVVSGFATTLSTATIAGGVFAVTIAAQVQAADVTIGDGGTQSEFSADNVYYNTSTTVDDVTTWGSSTLDVGEDDAEIYGINGGGTFTKEGSGMLVIKNTINNWALPDPTSVADIIVSEGILRVDAVPADDYYNQQVGSDGLHAFTSGTVTVMGGATLLLNAQNALGHRWNAVDSVILKGDSENVAILETTQTMPLHSLLVMQGNTLVKSDNQQGFDLFAVADMAIRFNAESWSYEYCTDTLSTLIEASGANNVISASLYERSASTIRVNEGGSLELAAGITQRQGISVTGGITKTGAGTLTITGDLNLSKQLVINEGILSLQGYVYGLGGGILLSETGVLEIGAGFVYMGALTEADGYYSTGITVAGATADNVVFAGSSYSLDSNNVLVMQATALTHSGTADWVWDFESSAFDNDALFKQGANVVFKGQSSATLGADIYALSMNVEKGASLSISNAEGAHYDVTLTQLTNAGSLSIGADTMVGTYDAVNSTGTFTVGNGATLTVVKVNYGDDKENVWNIFRAWDAQAGDTGLVVLQSGSVDFLNGYHFDDVNHVTGRYYVETGFTVNCWDEDKANAMTTEVDADAYLGVKGDVRFNVKQTVNVNGTMFVSGTLSMGHDYHDDRYYGCLTIGSTGAAVLNGLSFDTGGTASYLKLDGGTLILGAKGLTAYTSKAPLITLGSGVVASSAEGWSSALDMTVGNVSFHTSQQEADAMKGTWADSTDAEGKAIASTITLSGNVTAVADTTLKVTGVGSLTLNGAANTLANVQMDEAASLNISKQATVDTLTGGKVVLADSATLTVNGEGSNLVSLENKGTLNVQKGMTVSTYVAEAGSRVLTAAGATFAITDSTRYEADVANGANFWNLLASGVDAEGNIAEGTISLSGDIMGVENGASTGSTYEVKGHYLMEGIVRLINGGDEMSANIGAGSSLTLVSKEGQTCSISSWDSQINWWHWTYVDSGSLWLKNKVAFGVEGGRLSAEGKLYLGHELYGDYPSTLTISNDANGNEAVVSLGGVHIENKSADNKLILNSGKLIISGDMTDRYADADVHVFLNGGTLYSGSDSWTSSLVMSHGDVTINTTKQVQNADGAWVDATSDSRPLGATITYTQNAVAAKDSTLTVTGAGSLVLNGAQNELAHVKVDGAELALGTGGALVASGIEVSNGGVLSLLPATTEQSITMKGGTLQLGTTTLSGSVELAEGSNVIAGDTAANSVLTSAITVAAGSLSVSDVTLGDGAMLTNNGSVLTLTDVELAAGATLQNAASSTLNLKGGIAVSSAIENNGDVIFGEDMYLIFPSENLQASEGEDGRVAFTFTLLTGNGSVSGVEYLLDNYTENATFENGVLSFSNSVLSFAGSEDETLPRALTWGNADAVFMAGDTASVFREGDSVSFTGHTYATLTRDLAVWKLSVAEDASLELGGDYALTAKTFDLQGSLSYAMVDGRTSVSASAWQFGENAQISVDLSTGTYDARDVLPEGYTGGVAFADGRLNVSSDDNYRHIEVTEGGQLMLDVGVKYTGDVTIAGNGCSSYIDFGDNVGALNMHNSTLSGTLVVAEGGATVMVPWEYYGTLAGDVYLKGTLTRIRWANYQSVASLTISGNIYGGGGLTINEGLSDCPLVVQLGTGQTSTGTLETGDITLKAYSKLLLNHASGTFIAADSYEQYQAGNTRKANLTMETATLHTQHGHGDSGFLWGTLTANGENKLSYHNYGKHTFEVLTADAESFDENGTPLENSLSIVIDNNGAWEHRTQFDTILNFYGSITQHRGDNDDKNHTLVIGVVDLEDDTRELSITGGAEAVSFTKKGEGTLRMDTLTVSGSATMEAGKFVADSLSVAQETTLSAGIVEVDALTSNGKMTLNAGSLTATEVTAAEGLFINSGSLTADVLTVNEYLGVKTGSLAVDCLTLNGTLMMNYGGDFRFNELILGDSIVFAYDYTYGDKVLSIQDAAIIGDKTIVLNLTNVAGNVWDEGGLDTGITSDVREEQFAVLTGLKLVKDETSGTWKLMLDSASELTTSWDDRWNEAADEPRNMVAVDVATLESATLSLIDAGYYSYIDGAASALVSGVGDENLVIYGGSLDSYSSVNGESWIKVTEGTLSMVVGGSRQGEFNGDSHIYIDKGVTVDNVLGGNTHYSSNVFTGDTYITIDTDQVTGSVVGGGFAPGASYEVGNVSMTQKGDTHVFIYQTLADNSGVSWSDSRGLVCPDAVIGGHAALGGARSNLTLDGSTNISVILSEAESAEFNKKLIGGSFLWSSGSWGTQTSYVTHTGNTSVTVEAGDNVVFSGVVVGDSYLTPGRYYGMYDVPDWYGIAYSTLGGNSMVTLNGGSYEDYVVGGTYVNGTAWWGGAASYENQPRPGDSFAVIEGSSMVTLTGGVYKKMVMGGSAIVGASYYNGVTGATNYINASVSIKGGTNLVISGGEYDGAVLGGNMLSGVNSEGYIGGAGTHVNLSGDVKVNGLLLGGNHIVLGKGTIDGGTHLEISGGVYSGPIVAGNYMENVLTGDASIRHSGIINGGTYLSFGGETTLDNHLIGGDYLQYGSGSITGGTYISVSSKKVGGRGWSIVGGSYVEDPSPTVGYGYNNVVASIEGGTRVVLESSLGATTEVSANIIGGFLIDDMYHIDEATYSVDKTAVDLNGGKIVGAVVTGGAYVEGSLGASFGSMELGDVSLTLDGAVVETTLYGGSFCERNYTTATIEQKSVTLTLASGTLAADAYAAGCQTGSSSMKTGDTTVAISNVVVLSGERTISGGYRNYGSNVEVLGSKTLSFISGGDYTNISATLFREFDTVDVAKGGTVELVGAHGTTTQSLEMLLGANGGTLTKKGEGTFIMGSNMQGATVSVQGGTLKVNTTLTSVEVADGGALDAAAANAGIGALTLRGTTTLALDGATGLALGDADAAGVLTLDKNARLTLNVVNASEERIVLFTGLSKATISGISFEESEEGVVYADLASYVTNSGDFLGGQGCLILAGDGSLIIANMEEMATVWIWQNVTGGIWKDGDPEASDWNHATSPAGAPVVFSDTGMGTGADASTTITIEGEVKPASILVNATHGTYVFASSDTTPGSITGAATLTKEGAGTLRIENANSFSGGVILTEGVLEVANADALGKGVTRFNGGTLAYDLNTAHTVTGDELALSKDFAGTVNVALVGSDTNKAEDITWDFSGGESTAVLENGLKASGEGVLTLALANGSTGLGHSMTIADAGTPAEGTTPATVGTTVKLAGEDITFAYALTGQGTLDVSGTTGTSTLSGDNSAFEGSIRVSSGAGNITNFASNEASGGEKTTLILSDSTVELANGVTNIEAGTVQLIGENTLSSPATIAGALVGEATSSLLAAGGTVALAGSVEQYKGTLGTAANAKDVVYRFSYGAGSHNVNATISGSAGVTQDGSGTLVFTQANTATGTLTVNSGIVAIGSTGSVSNWSGDVDVNGTSELHLVNVAGGALAGAVTADADSTVKLQNSNGLTSISGGKLVVDGGSSAVSSTAETALEALQLVNGGNLSIGGDLAVKGSITSGGEGYAAGGDLTVSGGKLTIGSVNADGTRSDSRLSVGGALSGVSQVVIKGNLGPLPDVSDALMSVGSFSPASSNTLTFEFEDISQIRYMNLSAGDSYTLLQTETAISDALAKGLILKASDLARTTYTADSNTGDATYGDAIAVDDMDYSISWSSATNSVLLTATYNGNEWLGGGASDGWDAEAADWSQGVPDAGSSIGFMGKGSTTVGVEEAKAVANMRVDADSTYTLQSKNNSTVDVSGNLAIANGGLDIDGATLSAGSTILGSVLSEEQKADLSVGATAPTIAAENIGNEAAYASYGKLETGSLTIHTTTGRFVNNGLTSVTGALITPELANGQRLGLTNNGMLRMGSGSTVGTITGSGVVWATGGTATVAALDGAALAKASGGASLSVGSVNNALGFSLVDDTSTISIREGDVTASSLNSNGGLLNIAGKLTLEQRSTSGGRVETSHLDLAKAGNSSFTSVKTDALTLNLDSIWDSVAQNTPLLSLTEGLELNTTTSLTLNLSGSLTDAAAKLGFDNATLGSVNRDDDSGLQYTDYTLVGGVSLAGLSYSVTDAANLQQAFALAGTYAEVVLDENNNLVLRVHEDDPRTWNGGDVFDVDTLKPSESDDRWAGNTGNNEKNPGQVLDLSLIGNDTALDTVDVVNITEDTTITVSNMAHGSVDDNGDPIANPDGLLLNHLSGAADTTLTLEGEKEDLVTLRNSTDAGNGLGASEYKGTLVIDGLQVNVEGELGADNKPANTLTVGTTEFAGGSDSWLNVTDTADYRTGGLVSTAKDAGKISGTIMVTGTAGKANDKGEGGYLGSYEGATIVLGDGADQRLVLGAGANELSLISDPAGVTSANASLSYTDGNATMGLLNVKDTTITLDNMGAGTYNTLTVADGSTMTGGTLAINLKAADVAAGNAPTITSGLTLDSTKVHISQTDKFDGVQFNLADVAGGMTLFTLAGENLTQNIADYEFTGAFFERYFDTDSARVDANGAVKVDLIMDYYGRTLAQTENGTEGLKMLDIADLELNPKGNAGQYKDLAGVMASLQDYKDAKTITNEGDTLAAAVAGSGVASLGMALSGDVERQLKAIRNRTTTMGVDPSVVNEDMPYFNAWINAEGDYRSMDDGGTLAGYTVNSYGGTVGFDMDVTPELTWGLALTAMYGDFESTTVDKVDGDMDTYYVSAFARATHGAWTHTFVATVGMSKSELSRTVSHKYGSYTAEGEADGMSFGFLYEAARTYALNEDASTCWQPVFNVSFRHISVDGYEEDGSDAALKVGDQSLNTLTFGLGGRLQSIVGENVYNRTSVFEARALVKFDVGDRESEVENALINAPSTTATVKSAELDAIGLEVGVGLTVPVGFDAGSIFVDGSLEFRGSYTNFNAAAGYRVNF